MNSCIYSGWTRHRRLWPKAHKFRYRLFMLYLDLDELDHIFAQRWFLSTRRWAPMRFRRADYLGNANQPLADSVRLLVEQQTGQRPTGPIRLLTHIRYFGYCFNPISVYYCFANDADTLQAIVAEVSNTPWGERHCYVLSGVRSDRHHYQFNKQLHVSPFMAMDQRYDWRCNKPAGRLAVHIDLQQIVDGQLRKIFDATLALQRKPLTGWTLAQVLLRFPCMTAVVIVAIYWQALRLWCKGLTIIDHPALSKR